MLIARSYKSQQIHSVCTKVKILVVDFDQPWFILSGLNDR